jgi:hypothetical protein
VKLLAKDGKHVHAGMGLALQKNGDVVAGNFETGGLLEGRRVGLMGSPFKHRSKTKKFAVRGLVDDDLLMIFVNGRDPHSAGHHHISLTGGIADFVNALARSKMPHLDLTGEDGGFLVIKKCEKRNVF